MKAGDNRQQAEATLSLPKSYERIIPILPVLHQIFSEEREHRRSEHWVFANKYGNQSSHCSTSLRDLPRRVSDKRIFTASDTRLAPTCEWQESVWRILRT